MPGLFEGFFGRHRKGATLAGLVFVSFLCLLVSNRTVVIKPKELGLSVAGFFQKGVTGFFNWFGDTAGSIRQLRAAREELTAARARLQTTEQELERQRQLLDETKERGRKSEEDLAGRLETRHNTLSPLGFQTESGEQISFEADFNHDVLPYNFEIAEGVILPAQGYDFTNYQLSLNTATHRPAALNLSYHFGPYYSGWLGEWQAGLTVKLNGTANLSFNADIIRGRLAEGNFDENLYQLKADFFLSPDFGLMNYVQYDDISRQIGWSARLRWQISPGNEIYLVYNKNWERRWDPTSRFVPLEERGVLKISLSIRP